MATVSALKQHLPSEALLGRLLWYTVPELMVDHQTVVDALQAAGFTRALPRYPKAQNIFLRVTKDAQKKNIPHNGHETQTENWLMRDVTSRGEDFLLRRIVCEVRDPEGARLAYEQVADVEYDKETEAIRFRWLPTHNEETDPTAVAIMQEIRHEFAVWKGQLTAQAIRDWMRDAIMGMAATSVRSGGGLYFVREEYASQVEALEAFVKEVLPNGGECHSVEIPDNNKQREMIKKSIENETTGAIHRLRVEIDSIRADGKLTPDKYMSILADVEEMKKKIHGYSTLVREDITSLDDDLEMLDFQVAGLSPLQKKVTRTRKNKDAA